MTDVNETVYDSSVSEVGLYEGKLVRLKGWLYNKRSSGKVLFIILRDGTGTIQCVVSRADIGEDSFLTIDRLNQESSLIIEGRVRKDPRAPGGYEIGVTGFSVVAAAFPDYPISLKEHGIEFLLDHRHLWIRTPRQRAILAIRAEVMKACRDFLDGEGFIEVDAPILTPSACEGTTTLFSTDYFGEKAFLSQSGQLYNEAAIMALGRVYCFGPAFRAEKSKTRRHLTEFWMVEPEAAFMEFEELLGLEERMVTYVVEKVLQNREKELVLVGRNPEDLREVKPPFPRMTYDEAIKVLNEQGFEISWGEDFGAPHETALASLHRKPLFITHYPTQIKAFYMKPDPDRPEVVLGADLLAPEGYGEIIGGGERIADYDLLKQRLEENRLPAEDYGWYLDLRKYGSVPHSGFGMGIERLVTWICRLEHVRETIPFPRMLTRLRP
ncbi:MAG: asparagine--tRNA ligase [Candidatus Fermentithermobacillus carboniphilus]|uniref:Asparagine--tRNA ligase n=1 Tax=Candidatus Fermentithermobacillus carboniphilus TaxID=3085328 RepID=A0AAT9LC15_9FIRM|nr:MAG: asparagine--tRNA ligase [Candidatus Fermentithermobacillus carboniphilus]